ncbi:MAG: ABC transporter permease, partial [Proteobacteria bacterium]|nr:ABC transporter permease [Pseudomonadota bacterium]
MQRPPSRSLFTGLFFLLKRYLFPRGGSLLTLALWISIGGVALGVAQLMLVLSVMSGFLEFLQNKYTDITSALVVIPKGERLQEEYFRKTLEKIPGIKAVTPFWLGQAMLVKNGVGGVTLEGISLQDSDRVTDWSRIWVDPPERNAAQSPRWIWVGKGLADKLKIAKGDTVRVLMGRNRLQTEEFVVTAITKFGIYEHDLRYAYVDLHELQRLFQKVGSEPFYKVALAGVSLDDAFERVQEQMSKVAGAKRWSDINQNIFKAVRHQKVMLFWVLDIVVALAGMNVINLLMMSTYQRKRDVAILRAMGMRFKSIVLFFMAQGTVVGVLGVGVGIVLGFVLCWLVEHFQPAILSESIYNVSKLPLKVQMADLATISVMAVGLCVLFSVIPALKAAM